MKRRLFLLLVCLLSCSKMSAQRDSLSYRLSPFVKGGLTIGFLEGNCDTKNSGHAGFHLQVGLLVPFHKGDDCKWWMIPSVRYITKGNIWRLAEGERAYANIEYIELPVDVAIRINVEGGHLLLAGGSYLAYGIGGRLTGSNHQYIFHGYRLKDRPRIFGHQINSNRWDAGFNLMGMLQWQRLHLAVDIDIGMTNVVPARLDAYNNSKNNAISIGVGYTF